VLFFNITCYRQRPRRLVALARLVPQAAVILY
jgi:hypothetical protein